MNKKLTAEQREPMCLVCQMGITDDPCYCDELTAHIEPEDECERCHGVGELLHTPTGEYEPCPECHTEPEDDNRKGIAFSVLVDYCREVGGMKANIIGYFDWLQQDGKDKAEQEIIDDQEALRHHHG